MSAPKAHTQVRMRVVEAFSSLLGECEYAAITPTAIIKLSGVARSTFYRNYTSVNDVLVDYFVVLYDSFGSNAPPVNFEDAVYLTYVFRFYQEHATEFLNVMDADLSGIWLDTIIEYHVNQRGEMPAGSIDRYWLYYYAGAVYGVIRQWLTEGMPESPEQMGSALASRSFA